MKTQLTISQTAYRFIRPLLFTLNPELAHTLALRGLWLAHLTGISRFFSPPVSTPLTVMNLTFPNPIGLAAGFDKNGDYIDALAALGFGFIEIGTVTPQPQSGNPKPRLFRITKKQAIINRMGFNNKGMNYVASRLANIRYKGTLGVNIGKNAATPNEHAIDDYIACFRTLAPYASYIAINVSSPNTQGLRDLQQQTVLAPLLQSLKAEQDQFLQQHLRYVPLVVKISPDLSDAELAETAAVLLEQKIDGVIATNTTIQRDSIADSPYANEKGGLSGKPLQQCSTTIIRQLNILLKDNIPIIASGGIMDASSMQEKLNAGAKLVQVYTGFIYSGPGIIKL